MKISNKIRVSTGILLFLTAFFAFPGAARAESNINLYQSILPVKFVYLNNQRKIVDIWSNITENDNLYIVKFFDISKKSEINASRGLMANFQKTILENNFNLEPAFNPENKSYEFLSVEFLEEKGAIEEVRTLA